jgi:hypothetical protein
MLACQLPMSHVQESASKEVVETLVARLVSPNRAPTILPDGVPKYPPGYDKKAQKEVLRAELELHSLGPSALPYLFEHFADERYSRTANRGAAYDNFTVGDVCYDIVAEQLQPYGILTKGRGADARRRPTRPDYPRHIRLRDLKAAQTWWELHKKMTLREIQMEVLQWVIDEEAKTPTRYSDSERRWLAETLESLRKSDKPLE